MAEMGSTGGQFVERKDRNITRYNVCLAF